MSLIRSGLYALWFFLSIVLFGFFGLPFLLVSRNGAHTVIRSWAAAQRFGLRWICGVHTEFRGLENLPAGPCLVAMKHQSTYDTIAPFIFLPDVAFVLKEELLEQPIFGLYATSARMISIDRDGGAKTMRSMINAARKAASDGRQIVIFPEGTRQDVGAPPDYKPGVAGLYRALDLPCIPVALNTGLHWPGSRFPTRPGRVIIEAQAPIPPGLSREEFMRQLQAAIEPATARLIAS